MNEHIHLYFFNVKLYTKWKSYKYTKFYVMVQFKQFAKQFEFKFEFMRLQTTLPYHMRTPYSRSQSLTPRKFNSKSFKGLKLTLRKDDYKTLTQTKDKSIDSSLIQSTQKPPVNKFQSMPKRELFKNNIISTPPIKDYRNKSLPGFFIDKPVSAFTTTSKPYTKMFSNQEINNKNPESITPFSSRYLQSPIFNKQKGLNPILSKVVKGSLLNFDKSVEKAIKKQYSTQTHFKTQPQSPNNKNNDSLISQLYFIQTPKKQSSSKEGSTLKNLRNRITNNILEEAHSTVSREEKHSFQKKNNFQDLLSLNESPIKEKEDNHLYKENLYKKQIVNLLDKKQQQEQITLQQKQNYINLTPKVSQQLEISGYELTESPYKFNNRQSPFWNNNSQTNSSLISFTKPVKRKLSLKDQSEFIMGGQSHNQQKRQLEKSEHYTQNQQYEDQTQLLTQSTLLNSLLSSLGKQQIDKRQINLSLVRKCSQSLSLARINENNLIIGLVKLNKKQKFIGLNGLNDSQNPLILTVYSHATQFIITEPFEYTLEQIFQMKLFHQSHLPVIIKQFYSVINEINSKVKNANINLNKLKQRIVYTHGAFKLIPIVQIP